MGWGGEDGAKCRERADCAQRYAWLFRAKSYGNFGGLRAAVSGKKCCILLGDRPHTNSSAFIAFEHDLRVRWFRKKRM